MTEWLTDEDWRFQYFPLDEPEGSFAEFESIVALWRTISTSRLPSWSDFNILDFEGWWGWLSVYDAVDGQPLEFDVRLWGTEVVQISGHDHTGKRLSAKNLPDKTDPTEISSNHLKFVRFILDESVIGLATEPYRADWGASKLYTEILLPLSSDGANNDKVLFAGRLFE
jgi:hypothetical protein